MNGKTITEVEPGSWWDDEWHYRKNITINHTLVSANLSNFPVLINFASDDSLAIHAQFDGDDIVFTDIIGNKLNHEIELFNSTSGELVCWVNVSFLSSVTDTVLYMYYGNTLCDRQENVVGTWSSDYKIVQHLNELSGFYFDSTSYGNNGSLTDVDSDSGRGVNGVVGQAVHLSGDADFIDFGGDSSLGSTTYWTVSGWVNFDDLTTQVLWNRDISSNFAHGISDSTDQILVGYNGDTRNREDMDSVLDPGVWYHWTITCDDVNNYVRFYLNGVNQTLSSSSIFGSGSSDTFRIGSGSVFKINVLFVQ